LPWSVLSKRATPALLIFSLFIVRVGGSAPVVIRYSPEFVDVLGPRKERFFDRYLFDRVSGDRWAFNVMRGMILAESDGKERCIERDDHGREISFSICQNSIESVQDYERITGRILPGKSYREKAMDWRHSIDVAWWGFHRRVSVHRDPLRALCEHNLGDSGYKTYRQETGYRYRMSYLKLIAGRDGTGTVSRMMQGR
jgi:hypothetical protein